MTTYRTAKPEEFLDLIDLANFVFSHDIVPFDFAKLLPKVYGSDKNTSNIHKVAVSDDGKLRAEIACLPQTVHVCGRTLRAGFIGTVSVHPRARGEGHMKALMNAWIDELRGSCDLSVLGGQRQRYQYFGYTHGGEQVAYHITEPNIRHALRGADASPFSFAPLAETPGAEALALSLHNARPARVEREPALFTEALSSYGARPLAVLKSGKPAGYLAATDDGKTVQEAAFSDWDDFAPALKAYAAFSGTDDFTVLAPSYETELNRRLLAFAEGYRVGPNLSIRIFDFANVLAAYLTLKFETEGLVPGVFSAVLDGQPVTARADANGVTVERAALPGAPELSLLEAQELLLTIEGRYSPVKTPAGWFPLPLFWYNADNF